MNEELAQASKWYAHNYFEIHETNNYKALRQGFEAGAEWRDKQIINKEPEEKIIFTDPESIVPILELKANGDIFVKGKLVENDKEVVKGMKEFLESNKVNNLSE